MTSLLGCISLKTFCHVLRYSMSDLPGKKMYQRKEMCKFHSNAFIQWPFYSHMGTCSMNLAIILHESRIDLSLSTKMKQFIPVIVWVIRICCFNTRLPLTLLIFPKLLRMSGLDIHPNKFENTSLWLSERAKFKLEGNLEKRSQALLTSNCMNE